MKAICTRYKISTLRKERSGDVQDLEEEVENFNGDMFENEDNDQGMDRYVK